MRTRRLYAGALVLLFSTIYGLTLVPGIGLTGDSIKFQYIGRVLGVPHSTGYPLYISLNHIFTALPIKSAAFRANLMSAVLAVLTLVVFFIILVRLTGSASASFVSAAFFGLTATFWSQAVVAEVYTLAAFSLVLILWTLLEWEVAGRPVFFILFLFVFALSLGNHLTVAACLPAALVFIILVEPGVFRRTRYWLLGLAALVLGLGQYGLLFLRTAQAAPYLEHEIRTFQDLLRLVTGHQFRGEMFAFSFRDLLTARLPLFAKMLVQDITWMGLVLALAGTVFLFFKKRKAFVLLFLVLLGQAAWVLNTDIRDIQTHMIPVVLACCLAAGFGLASLLSLVRKRPPHLLPLALLPLLAWMGAANAARVGIDDDPEFRTRLERDRRLAVLFENIPPYSVILTDNYPDTQNVHYRRLIDYPEKHIIPHLLNPREPAASQLSTKLVVSLQTLPGLQDRLGLREELKTMKNRSREAVGLHLLRLLRASRRIQDGFASHVYVATEDARSKLSAEGIPIAPFTARARGGGRLFLFYRVSLYDPGE